MRSCTWVPRPWSKRQAGRPAELLGSVRKVRGLPDAVHDVDSEPVDAAVHPEPQDVDHRRPARRGGSSRGRAARAGTGAGSTGRSPRRGSTPARRRTRRASCWAVRRRGRGRARRTSPASGLSTDDRAARNHGCWSEVWFGTYVEHHAEALVVGGRGSARRRRRGPRTGGRRRSGRRCRSRSRPSVSGRTGEPDGVDPQAGEVAQVAVAPGRSPTPSPSESAKLRGYTWYTTPVFHHGHSSLSERWSSTAGTISRGVARAPIRLVPGPDRVPVGGWASRYTHRSGH